MARSQNAVGDSLVTALGLNGYSAVGTFHVYSLSLGADEIPEATAEAASWGMERQSVMLTNGRAEDGGLGDTDWDSSSGEYASFRLTLEAPPEARALYFTTQLSTAEFSAPDDRNIRDLVYVSLDNEYLCTNTGARTRLDTIAHNNTGPRNPALLHAVDLTRLGTGDRCVSLNFVVWDETDHPYITDGSYDTGLELSRFYFSETTPPPPSSPVAGNLPTEIRPTYPDVRLLAGSYTRSEDLVSLPGEVPIRFSLVYNSESTRLGRQSWYWNHTYEIDLMELATDDVMIRHGNGQNTYFEPDDAGGFRSKYGGNPGALTLEAEGSYTYTTETQQVYDFDPVAESEGLFHLSSLTDPNGNRTLFTYTPTGDLLFERLDMIETEWSRLDIGYADYDGLSLLTSISANGVPIVQLEYEATDELYYLAEATRPGATATSTGISTSCSPARTRTSSPSRRSSAAMPGSPTRARSRRPGSGSRTSATTSC